CNLCASSNYLNSLAVCAWKLAQPSVRRLNLCHMTGSRSAASCTLGGMRDRFWGALGTLAALGSVACSLLAPSDAELGESGGAANDGAAGGSCAAEPVAAIPQSAGIVLVVDGHGGLKQVGGAFAEVQKGVSQFAHDERVT